MTEVEKLASFTVNASYDKISEAAREQLKIRLLDSLACAVGAVNGEIAAHIRNYLGETCTGRHCTLIGGGTADTDRAAFYNSALIRYLDFNDSYLGKGETCHPSDNIGAVLACSEYAGRNGKDFLTALAVAYQVQCRLSDVAPVRAKGFDHTVQGSYAAAAGISKALNLDTAKTANAIAISGTAFNALRVTRTGLLSHWKGLAYPNTAYCCVHAAFLARHGITGPLEVFEGNKGFKDTISGQFEIDWSKEDLERVTKTIIKKYNAEIHSQVSIENILEMKKEHRFTADDIEKIRIEIFDVAYNIIGGGEEGDKTIVSIKEQADHSLQYIVAAAILDGTVMPAQYDNDRILRSDIQDLLRKVEVIPSEQYSRYFPDEMPSKITVILTDSREVTGEKRDYEGFHTRPMRWETVIDKFNYLSESFIDSSLREEIIDSVDNIEKIEIADLMQLLSKVKIT
ncbi:MmgE/PrpD family protein [candidate division KSB1 bacterium]